MARGDQSGEESCEVGTGAWDGVARDQRKGSAQWVSCGPHGISCDRQRSSCHEQSSCVSGRLASTVVVRLWPVSLAQSSAWLVSPNEAK